MKLLQENRILVAKAVFHDQATAGSTYLVFDAAVAVVAVCR